jgi:sugar lactone lactonase YvrE
LEIIFLSKGGMKEEDGNIRVLDAWVVWWIGRYITPTNALIQNHHRSIQYSFHITKPQSSIRQSFKMRLTTPFLSTLLPSVLATTLSTVYQFPPTTWLENIVLTRNYSLLTTLIGNASVYMVDPTISPASSNLVATFPDANSVLGISEIKEDVFAVAVGTVNTTDNTPKLGSFSIWSVDLANDGYKGVNATKILDVPNMGLPNGLAALSPDVLLVADSWNGNIVAVDVQKKTYEVVLDHPSLHSDFATTAPLVIGVNGLKFHARTSNLYYGNTVLSLLGRVHINTTTGAPTGPYEIITQGQHISQPDDFAVLSDGSVLLARPLGDTLQHIALNGSVRDVARGGLASGATGVVLGKGEVFLSESGLEGGMKREGGRIVKIEV